MKKMHLICNAHIDPVWQWEWEEGVGAAISTFRVAAELCEKYDNFVFNHNEAILYKWIEEYEPVLFQKIQQLVTEGKWHIMGGWYLQPDCNLPSGESFTRQMLEGLSYFKEKFGARPKTAINFDPFGHTKGLVQIMEKCGFTGYIITRPPLKENPRFIWKGFADSKLSVLWLPNYNSLLGKAHEKLGSYITESQKDEELGVMLWGVGNHGGGPSKKDLEKLDAIIKDKVYDTEICHSTPEEFFADLEQYSPNLPVVETSLQHAMVGCYTSQIRIKQKHRQLENELYMAEKMASHAASMGLMEYPKDELKDALQDLLFAEFHDILPGSSIQKVEDASLGILDHGLEIASRVKGRAFFKLSAGQERATDGELPILVYNPLPYKLTRTISCEFMLADQNLNEEFTNSIVYSGDKRLPCQPEKESSNVPIDWRKKVVFEAELEPLSMNRFDVKFEVLKEKPGTDLTEENGYFTLSNEHYTAKLNVGTGLLDSYQIGGKEYVKPGAAKLLVIADNEDPWGMKVEGFQDVIGEFVLAAPAETAKIAAVNKEELPSVRVIEDGEIRTIIEAIFVYNQSQAVIRYTFPKTNSEIGINVRTIFIEKDKMLKLSVPTVFETGEYLGKTAFGVDDLRNDGNEVVAQDFVVITDKNQALSVINTGTYGSSCKDGEIRMSLVRTAAYCAHPLWDRTILPQERFTERIEQGERLLDFYLNASDYTERMAALEKESSIIAEKPMAICFFPPEEGEKPLPLCVIDNETIKLSALKTAADGNGYIVRLFNSDLGPQEAAIELPTLGVRLKSSHASFEVKTYRIANAVVSECSLCEEEL